jgi:putative transcription factor
VSYYCEMCGREVDAKSAKRVVLDGSPLIICLDCYSKLSKKTTIRNESAITSTSALRSKRPIAASGERRSTSQSLTRAESYEVVENYHQVVRTARERLGWSQEVLASKVGESVNTIRRIESGKLKPTLELARRLERVLRVKLVEPVVDSSEYSSPSVSEDLTIGDLLDTGKLSRRSSKGSR